MDVRIAFQNIVNFCDQSVQRGGANMTTTVIVHQSLASIADALQIKPEQVPAAVEADPKPAPANE